MGLSDNLIDFMKIYLARNNVQAGPYTLDELNTMLSSHEVLLDDLMWHKGMTTWQTVGEMTGGRYVYTPTQEPPTYTPPPQPNRGFGDNVDMNPPISQAEQRVSVAQLYGKKQPDQSPHIAQNPTPQTAEYASVASRFGAFIINVSLYIAVLSPLIMAFANVVDMNEIAKHGNDYTAMQTYSQSLLEQIPASTIATSNLMFFALIGFQLLLIMMRGQSLGKLLFGIRIVSETTGKLPSFGTLVMMRTLFIVVLYILGATMFSGLPAIIMLLVNYVQAKNNDKHQGWHDKITKTMIVKAKSFQLDKTKK